MRKIKWQPIFFILACCLSMPFDSSLAASREWLNRVDAWVIETASGSETEFILFLNEQADLSQTMFLPDKKTKGAFVYETLHRTAESSQKPILQVLDALGVEYRPYWVANMIWVRGGMQAVQAIASRQDVAHLYANPTVRLDLPEQDTFPTQALQPQGIEWNLSLVNADDVWAAGFTGQGAVIGGADTGYQWEHPALKRQYRGWDGLAVDHNYNWHDAIHSNNPNTAPGNPCGFDVAQPCDDHGHGTHTMGIMVGDDGTGNQIGMAPGARWIGCRNMEQGWGSPITYAECYQWFIAPTDLNDQKPNPELAPDVINNSWSCPASEGCVNPEVLRQVVENVRAAGILTVHSAGNSGPSCSSISQPAAIYDASFSVGNTTAQNGLSSSSSRGPVLADGSGRLKPDITAPGTSIRSSYPGGYTRLSGTSMAAPHVAGMAALLISADPALGGQVDKLEQWITQTAFPLSIPLETCGGIPSTTIPNNSFGWGRINAWGPFIHRLHIRKSAFPAAVLPGETVTYTLTTANLDLIDIAHGILLTDTLPVGTAFLTASSPYTLAGRTVRWELAELPPGISWEVQLTVQATGSPGSLLINSDFGLTHQEGWFFTRGADIWTPILFQYYIPFFIWDAIP